MGTIKTRTEYAIVGGDFSAQEPRLLTHMSNEGTLRKTFEEGRDPYATISSFVFKKDYWDCMEHHEDGTPNPEGKALRSKAKSIMLGILYGMGAKLLSTILGTSMKECKEILKEFYTMFPGVKAFTDANEKSAKENGYVEDYLGRRRHLPDAMLEELEITQKKKIITNADIFVDCQLKDAELEIPDDELIKIWTEYWNTYKNSGRYDAKKEFKEIAKKEGISVYDNGAFISKTLTQCTNARVQGCLSGDTYIHTLEDGIVKIKNAVGNNKHVWDGDKWTRADVVYTGKKQKCIIEFTNKETIVCSPNHMFATSNSTNTSKYVFKRCDELKIDDAVCNITHNFNYIKNITITNDYIDMYDVCDTDSGYFVADGVIVHNSAASLTKKAMINIANDKKMNDMGFRILIPVHDELLGECPKYYAKDVEKRLVELMTGAAKPECSVAMKCDTYVVKHWYADEVNNAIHDKYVTYIKKGVSPDEAYGKLCEDYCDIPTHIVREMCNETFDELEDIRDDKQN